ncbi:MAG TPA: hypothetical protein VMB03_29225 [Bryobacteraceae bacterium]|nr:hypothetical protein [Bryobacteraceae bacterium]
MNRFPRLDAALPLKLLSLAALAASLASAQGIFGSNLIVNGGAESGPGGDGTSPVSSVPGWLRTGGCDVYAYQSAFKNVNAIQQTDIVPRGAGLNYFAGGEPADICTFTENPAVDLSSGAATIDAGSATYEVSGYFGGYGNDTDNATLTVSFQNAGGTSLGSVTVGGVGPDDRDQQAGLYFRRSIGPVPAGTRKATVTLTMTPSPGTQNEGFADNLAFILHAPGSAQSLLGVNLIANPGADASTGWDPNAPSDRSADLSGWVRSAYLTADSYEDDSGDLYQVAAVPADSNANYFYGGNSVTDSSNPAATGYQDIDVSSAASLIDAGNLPFTFSAWLGGYSDQNDNCVLNAQFEKWDGTVLSTSTLGPVMSADRNGNSSLLQRSTSGTVPAGTRFVHILMTMTRTDGSDNDGLADSLSLIFGSNGNVAPEISQTVISAGAFGAFDAVTTGTWMEIYGANLASETRQWTGADFNGTTAPTSLSGTSVTIGGVPAYIYFISSGQVNALVPGNVPVGMQPVVVQTATGASLPFLIDVHPAEPGFLAPPSFSIAGYQYLAALFLDGQTFAIPPGAIAGVPSREAKPGDTIVVYGIGFGAVTPALVPGQIEGQSNSLALPVQVMFGNSPATLSYFGLAPNFVGLYQFNIMVPNVPNNDQTPITFTLNGVPGTQTLYVAVHN